MKDLLTQLKEYKPWNEQEETDVNEIIRHLESGEDIYNRTNTTTHLTCSAWITNKTRDKVLMANHIIHKSWAWLGGHADGDTNPLNVVIKEANEESSLSSVVPISKRIFSVEIVPEFGHIKHGKYVSSHLHYNITYLLEADQNEETKVREGENTAVQWFNLEDAIKVSNEDWVRNIVYRKLNEKLKSKQWEDQ